jgi:hypothetical protein
MLLQETGDLQGALEAGQRAFAIFQKRLPAGHSRLEAEGSRLAQLNILMVVAEMLKAQS